MALELGTKEDVEKLKAKSKDLLIDMKNVVQDSDGVYVYLIQRGDTLTKISQMFGYSVDELANSHKIHHKTLNNDRNYGLTDPKQKKSNPKHKLSN